MEYEIIQISNEFNTFLYNFLDLHDVVMRFNHAPTAGYEADVGTKTTIRVVNSQVRQNNLKLQ